MLQLKISDLIEFVVHSSYKLNEPVFVWGAPGIGKSEAMRQAADMINAYFADVRLSQYDSVDIRGFPGVDATTNTTVWHMPSTLPFVGNDAFPDDQPIMLFFDEMNSCTIPVQAAVYQIINERRAGEHVLKPNVFVVAAGNRETDKGITNRQSKPLSNRFTHVEAVADVEDWSLIAQDRGVPPEGIAFLNFRKDLLNQFDPASPDKAFPTPRSWMKAFKYLNSDARPAIKEAQMCGAVGVAAVTQLNYFVTIWQKVMAYANLPAILRSPDTAKVPQRPEDELSEFYAVAVFISGSMTKDNADVLHRYLLRLDPEFTILAWQLAMRRTRNTPDDVIRSTAYTDFAKRFKGVITA